MISRLNTCTTLFRSYFLGPQLHSFLPPNATDESWLGLANSVRSEDHTSELQSRGHLVCRLLLEKKNAGSSRAPADSTPRASPCPRGRKIAPSPRRPGAPADRPCGSRRSRRAARARSTAPRSCPAATGSREAAGGCCSSADGLQERSLGGGF